MILPSSLFSWLSTGALCLGAALLLWGLRGWKPRPPILRWCGSRRCGYDMTATPGLRCPECGALARSERGSWLFGRGGMRRRLIRRKAIAAAALLLITSFILAASPRLADEGAYAFIPTSILIRIAPVKEGPTSWDRYSLRQRTLASGFVVRPGQPQPRTKPPADLNDLTWRRLAREGPSRHQRYFVERWLRAGGERPAARVPERWLADKALPIFPARSSEGWTIDWSAAPRGEAYTFPAGTRDVRITFRITTPEGKLQGDAGPYRITFVDSMDRLLLSASADVEATVREILRPSIVMIAGVPRVVFPTRENTPKWNMVNCAVGYEYDVLLAGAIIGSGQDLVPQTPDRKHWSAQKFEWRLGGAIAAATNAHRLRIAIRAAPRLAASQYLEEWWWGRGPIAWHGSFECVPRIPEPEQFGLKKPADP